MVTVHASHPHHVMYGPAYRHMNSMKHSWQDAWPSLSGCHELKLTCSTTQGQQALNVWHQTGVVCFDTAELQGRMEKGKGERGSEREGARERESTLHHCPLSFGARVCMWLLCAQGLAAPSHLLAAASSPQQKQQQRQTGDDSVGYSAGHHGRSTPSTLIPLLRGGCLRRFALCCSGMAESGECKTPVLPLCCASVHGALFVALFKGQHKYLRQHRWLPCMSLMI